MRINTDTAPKVYIGFDAHKEKTPSPTPIPARQGKRRQSLRTSLTMGTAGASFPTSATPLIVGHVLS